MPLQSTDLLMVNRGGVNYKVSAGNFTDPGYIQPTDLIMVQRGDTLYQLSKSELFSTAGVLETTDFLLVERNSELFSLHPAGLPSTIPYFQLGFTASGVNNSESILNFQWTNARPLNGVPAQLRLATPNGTFVVFLGTSGFNSYKKSDLGNGIGQVTVYGKFDDIGFLNSKGLVQMTQSATGAIQAMMPTPGATFGQSMFFGCRQLATVITNMPVQNMSAMFQGCTVFNQSIASMPTGSVENFSNTFRDCPAFNKSISLWDTSSATTMFGMFQGAVAFDQSLNSWGPGLGKVTSFGSMFIDAVSYNQPMNQWDVSAAGSQGLNNFFNSATAFSQDLTSWCVTNFASAPTGFSGGSALTNAQLPVWGTCP